MKKAMIAMICVMTVLALSIAAILGVLLIANPAPEFGFSFGKNLQLANRQVYSAGDFEKINIAYSSESITILPSANNEIVLEEYMSRKQESLLAHVNTNGNTLSIKQGERGFLFMWFARVKIYLPPDWLGTLQMKNSSGSIQAEDDFSLQALDVKVSSGSIRFQSVTTAEDISLVSSSGGIKAGHLSSGGNIALSSTSGSVKVENATANAITASASSGGVHFEIAAAEKIDAKSSSGSVMFGHLEGIFELRSSSGRVSIGGGRGSGSATASSGGVHIELEELLGDLALKSTSGSVSLSVPNDAAFTFYASTNSGSIRTPFDQYLAFTRNGKEANGSVGSAPTHLVTCTASSGSVRVEWV